MQMFVMGDHRMVSQDSRCRGRSRSRTSSAGRSSIVWPPQPLGVAASAVPDIALASGPAATVPTSAAAVSCGHAAFRLTDDVSRSAGEAGAMANEAAETELQAPRSGGAPDSAGRWRSWSLLVRAFVLQTFYIPSESMEHTLDINDRVLVNKLVYDFRDPHRGEIIVFEAPRSWRSDPSEEDFIKRVIGVGGDHVVCCDDQGRITVNGEALDEPYIYRTTAGQHDAAQPRRVRHHRAAGPAVGDGRPPLGLRRLARSSTGARGDVVQATIPVDVVVGGPSCCSGRRAGSPG